MIDEIAADYAEITRLLDDLEYLPDKFRRDGHLAWELEYEYDRVKLEKTLELTDMGYKITFIKENVDGYEDVGLAKLKARVAQIDVEADREEINAKKLKLRILNEQIARDYGRPSNL